MNQQFSLNAEKEDTYDADLALAQKLQEEENRASVGAS